MATKKSPAKAHIDYLSLLLPTAVDVAGILRFLRETYQATRLGKFARGRARFAVFDPATQDLASLEIGLLEDKVIALPRKHVPKTSDELKTFCRRLIDRGEDEAHLRLMLKEWPESYALDDHVEALWRLRSLDRRLFEDLVRGRFGRVLCQLGNSGMPADLMPEQLRRMLVGQSLLWCAFDVQMVAANARASLSNPLGELLSVTPGEGEGDPVVKLGGVLREMREALEELETLLDQLEAAPAITPEDETPDFDFEFELKPETRRAKMIGHYAEKQLASGGKRKLEWSSELAESIPLIRDAVPQIRANLDEIEACGNDIGKDARLLTFFAAWNVGLTPVDGLAVSLFRYVQAEKELDGMIDDAIVKTCAGPGPVLVSPLPALPDRKAKPRNWQAMKRRVADLLDSARRAQLNDDDWRSRDKGTRTLIRATVSEEPSVASRESHERAGWKNIKRAETFLRDMGPRRHDALNSRHADDRRHRVYWKLDVVPELRIFC